MRTIDIQELGKGGELIERHERALVRQGERIVAILEPLSAVARTPDERSRRYEDAVSPVAHRLDELGVTEDDVQRDFAAWKNSRRGR
ncbi:MAG: hypothetical protein HY900_18825 [Deltaproteobacteria bacterium]|nr:hypothetical protein [Deltaproteobacteria bacterium]